MSTSLFFVLFILCLNGPTMIDSRKWPPGGGFPKGSGFTQHEVLEKKDDKMISMPNMEQVQMLLRQYAPIIYFHPDEIYLPSSVDWYFENGALLYDKGNESNTKPIEKNGSNLPQGSINDKTYWLDLPIDKSTKDSVKKGNLEDACAYIHVKPALGGLLTDISVWIFFPFNGPVDFNFLSIPIPVLGGGKHVSDWEHVTLRINNSITSNLESVYFGAHNTGGRWMSVSDLERNDRGKVVVYASLNSHRFYSKHGVHTRWSNRPAPALIPIGLRDATAKSDKMMDTGARYVVVAAEHLGKEVVEPAWLNYFGKWGPKHGSVGPKAKNSWTDEE